MLVAGAVVPEAEVAVVFLGRLLGLYRLREVPGAVCALLPAARLLDLLALVHLLPLGNAEQAPGQLIGRGDPGSCDLLALLVHTPVSPGIPTGRHAGPDLVTGLLGVVVLDPEDDMGMDGPA